MTQNPHSFDSCFEVFLANTPEAEEIHYRIRYRVYCDEMGFEDKQLFPDGLERDEWDSSAVHFLVRHKFSGEWLGALRLVRPEQRRFPFEEHCTPYRSLPKACYSRAVEISRLCVVKEARRFALRKNNSQLDFRPGNVSFLHDYRNLNRSIMWGLYRAATVYSARSGIDDWFILVTPALAYFVNKEGFRMRQIGDACDHRGQRTPYRLSVKHILQNPLWQQDYQQDYRLYSELAETRAVRYGGRDLRQIGVVSFVSRA